jgi:WD40 repeat protein
VGFDEHRRILIPTLMIDSRDFRRWSCFLLLGICTATDMGMAGEPTVSFRAQIAPILRDHCLPCHGPKKTEGGYRIDTYEQLKKPGDSGAQPIAVAQGGPVDTRLGELLRRVASEEPAERMPPESDPLPKEQIELLRQWLQAGGAFDGQDATQRLSQIIPVANYSPPVEHYPRPIPIGAIAYSPDGQFIATSGYHEILIWKKDEGVLARRIQNVPMRTHAIEFDRDGQNMLIAGGEPGRTGEARWYLWSDGSFQGELARFDDVFLDASIRPGYDTVALACTDGAVRLVSRQTPPSPQVYSIHGDWVNDLCWSADGALLATASRDKTAKVLDAQSGLLKASYSEHNALVRGVCMAQDGKSVWSVSVDGKLHRWGVDDGKRMALVSLGSESFRIAHFKDHYLVPSFDRRIHQIDPAKNAVAFVSSGHQASVLCVAISPDGNEFASGSHDGQVMRWSMADGKLRGTWSAVP